MKNNRIVLIDIYSNSHGLHSRVDITGESYSYVNISGKRDLKPYLSNIVRFIYNDTDINQSNCRFRFSFSRKIDYDSFIEMITTSDYLIPQLETASMNNFHTMNGFLSYSCKPHVLCDFEKNIRLVSQ